MKVNGFRFIVGSGCNYDCFFCHHEGYIGKGNFDYDLQKLKILKRYADKNNIKDISITGGEPFIYWEKVKKLLNVFDPKDFRVTLNTNATFISEYKDELSKMNKIEFHVNVSSLDKEKHRNIIGKTYLDNVLENLKLLKDLGHDVCLNIPVLKNVNDNELVSLLDFCNNNSYKARFLVLYDTNNDVSNYVLEINEILKRFTNAIIMKSYSYGRYDIKSEEGDFEIVRCLCAKHECKKCQENTFIHFTPNLNMKYCMESDEEIDVNYRDLNEIEKSVKIFNKKLNKIVRSD